MDKILYITNGDCALEVMKEAGIVGDILPWRDVLHDGPVPESLSLESLSEIRAQFIIDRGWGESEKIKQDFVERDKQLNSYNNYKKVVLWFEHDLYDQLQIIQLLDWFSKNSGDEIKLSMICTDNYLGMVTPEEMQNLIQFELPVSKAQLTLSSKAWTAFCANTPIKWASLLDEDTSALPFLESAILRQLEEYPDCTTGLSRTAFHALNIFSQGETRCGEVFGEYNKTEERRFLGDLSFWNIIGELARANPPLLILDDGSSLQEPVKQKDDLIITQVGKDVLAGKLSFFDCFDIDRWIGGTHLSKENVWCWDGQKIEKRFIS